MNEKIRQLLDAVGAMAEMCKASYDSFVDAGFTPVQALALTQAFLQTILQMAQGGSHGDD